MFVGEYKQKMTGRGRLLLPVKLRQQVRGEEIVLAKGFDGCLFGYDKAQWEEISRRQMENSALTDSGGRDLRRYLFTGAAVLTLDAQGRFVIPPALSAYGTIGEEATVVGAGDHFEIWEPGKWESRAEELEKKMGGQNN